ncbi:uncharacterized protein J7T54_004880 [Emericellopsis cladophorae]|uniref:Acireductone dioxygenase n=1 Tax=Emericellopsis cladophorae TaxID=2686198 RepID=A0A9Q0BBN7_9HYPO|nr:uncharacterized protein J7T54_004880 [Emericellopsis cladophorae]KAI6778249.1 hypothetical protein J7T54_004880 [Emericellopsis cladophorae]
MYDGLPGDQRLPHDSGREVGIDALAKLGVLYYHLPEIDGVNQLAAERGYKNRDEIRVSPEAMGDVYEDKVKMFFHEHLHEDEEIRYIRGGQGYFDVRSKDDEWVRVLLAKDDLLILPPGIYHRFTTDESNVFGGTGHMGRSLVKCALSRGDFVVSVGRVFEDDLHDTPGRSENLLHAVCDVRSRESVLRPVQRALDHFGRIDVVANCSGYGVIGACEDQDEHDLRNQFETNFMGTVHIIHATLPYFRRQNGGRYLIFSSTSGALGVPGLGPYCATKYAVEVTEELEDWKHLNFPTTADDKKNEDYVVRMSDHAYKTGDRSPFGSMSPSSKPYGNGSGGSTLSSSVSKLDNSPMISILAYCASSISMTVAMVGTGAITACKQFGLIKALAPFESERAKKWFPISVLLVSMIYTGAKALQYLSVPVYTIFKNLTIIVIAYGEVLWFGGSVTPLSLVSFGLMVISSVVAAWADIQSALAGDFGTASSSDAVSTLNAGYAWMGMNVFCSASYLLSMRKVIKKMNFKDWDSMYYNNLLTIPVLLVLGLLTEDWSSANLARNFPPELRVRMGVGIVYSGLAAIFISYCSAWCIRVTSSTTYSMVGALNKLPIAISGLVFFSAPVTFGSVSAIAIGFVSGIIYALARVKQSSAAKDSLPMTRIPMSASSQSNKDAISASSSKLKPTGNVTQSYDDIVIIV